MAPRRWFLTGVQAMLVLLAACAGPARMSAPGASVPFDAPATSAATSPASSPVSVVPAASWELLDAAPLARIEAAAAEHDGVIWLAGGLNADGSASDETWRYDPAAESWAPGPPLPGPLHHAAMVSTGDSLLVIGGYGGSSFDVPQAGVLRLNGVHTAWEEAPALPEPRAAGAAAWDGDRVVYAGGVRDGRTVSDVVLAFDGARWFSIGRMVAPREHLSAASDGAGHVWLLGGRTLSLDTNVATVEYVEGRLVARVAELPTPRGGAAAFYLPGVGACLSGGEQASSAFDEVECVGENLEISELPPLAEPRHGHSVAVVDDAVYVLVGGPEPRLTVSDTVQRLALDAS